MNQCVGQKAELEKMHREQDERSVGAICETRDDILAELVAEVRALRETIVKTNPLVGRRVMVFGQRRRWIDRKPMPCEGGIGEFEGTIALVTADGDILVITNIGDLTGHGDVYGFRWATIETVEILP